MDKTNEIKSASWYDSGSLSCRCGNCGCKSPKEYGWCPNCGWPMTESAAKIATDRVYNGRRN